MCFAPYCAIIVAQTNLVPELQKVADTTFFVYGFNKDENHGNVILRKFSEVYCGTYMGGLFVWPSTSFYSNNNVGLWTLPNLPGKKVLELNFFLKKNSFN